MRTAIVVYQMIPDQTLVFNLAVTDGELLMLTQCHNQYCNTVGVPDDHPVNQLSEWLDNKKENIVFDSNKEELQLPVYLPPDAVMIVSGFLC